jgi:hypothetical protein
MPVCVAYVFNIRIEGAECEAALALHTDDFGQKLRSNINMNETE